MCFVSAEQQLEKQERGELPQRNAGEHCLVKTQPWVENCGYLPQGELSEDWKEQLTPTPCLVSNARGGKLEEEGLLWQPSFLLNTTVINKDPHRH